MEAGGDTVKMKAGFLGVGALLLCSVVGLLVAAAHGGKRHPARFVDCALCVTGADCGAGTLCAQFGGDAYCAADCGGGQGCDAQHACTSVATIDGEPASVCVPVTDPCGANGSVGITALSSDAG